MTDQWQELKETIIELRDGDGTTAQQEVCKFLANYMDILEKQMQESSGDVVSKQVVIDIVDSYSESQSNVEDVIQDIISDIVALPHINPQPCEDAISRQAALNASYALCDTGKTLKENPWRDNPHIDVVVETIEELPSVNPRAKTGHWIRWYEQKETERYTECIPHCKCSECGKEYDPFSSQFIKYCNECGAKMIEPQAEREG